MRTPSHNTIIVASGLSPVIFKTEKNRGDDWFCSEKNLLLTNEPGVWIESVWIAIFLW